ncbi:hypothetical protein [Rhodoblastus sp.]|uniref:hypothetical protein n=1 Tax=Rhodoblastus sp. TaxID=1962975 RepID=UPI003F975B06
MLPAPDARLTRQELAKALTEAGYPISHSTLASMATRGGGPLFQHWGSKPIYAWAEAVAWAEARISRPVTTTAEAGRYRPQPRARDKAACAASAA